MNMDTDFFSVPAYHPTLSGDVKNISAMLMDPNFHTWVVKDPAKKKAVAKYVLKLKEERESKKRKLKQMNASGESAWFIKFLSTFDCLGWTNLCSKEPSRQKGFNMDKPPLALKRPESLSKSNGHDNLQNVKKSSTVFSCSTHLDEFTFDGMNIKDIKLHLDSCDFPGSQFMSMNKCQELAEMLLQSLNLSPSVLLNMFSPIMSKSRSILDHDGANCTDRKFVLAQFSPYTSCSQLIILMPKKATEHPYYSVPTKGVDLKMLTTSFTQTDETETMTLCEYCECTSTDSKSSTQLTSFNERDRENIHTTSGNICTWNSEIIVSSSTVPASSVSNFHHGHTYTETSKDSLSDYEEDPVSYGARFLSKIFNNSQVSPDRFLKLDTEVIIEGTGNREGYYLRPSLSLDSYEDRRSRDSFESNMQLRKRRKTSFDSISPEGRNSTLFMDDTTEISTSELEIQQPPEISTGFSALSVCDTQSAYQIYRDSSGTSSVGSEQSKEQDEPLNYNIIEEVPQYSENADPSIKNSYLNSCIENVATSYSIPAESTLRHHEQHVNAEESDDSSDVPRTVTTHHEEEDKARVQRRSSLQNVRCLEQTCGRVSRKERRASRQRSKLKHMTCSIM